MIGKNMAEGDSIRFSLDAHRSPKIIAIAGGKSGVGKTLFASMLGMCLAGFERRTILVDLDLSGANLYGLWHLPDKTRSLNSFFSGRNNTLSEVVQRTPFENLDAITLQSDALPSGSIKPWTKRRLFSHLKKLHADFVILDLGNASTPLGLDAFLFADQSLIVTSADMFSVLNTYSLIRSAVLQGIRRTLYDSPTALRAVDECGLLFDSRAAKPVYMFLKQIPATNYYSLDAIRKFLRRFSPGIVLNFAQDDEIYNDFILLGPLVKDLLSIQLDYWGQVRFDSSIQSMNRAQLPDQLLHSQGLAADDVVKIVIHNILARELSADDHASREWVNKIDSNLSEQIELDGIKCRQKCLVWNGCSVRNEGGPCSKVASCQMKKAG